MKFNFKKITSVFASAVMLGSTMGIALAANYPTPFITSGNQGDAAVVVGGAASVDYTPATSIINDLNPKIKATGGTTLTGGDSYKIERSSDKFNLGDSLYSIRASLTDDHLPVLLADGVYTDDNNDEFKYTQKIVAGPQNNFNLSHFADSDYKDKEPTIGFKLTSNTRVLNYTLDFTKNPMSKPADLETTDLPILGKTYYILDWASGNTSMTLLDSAKTVTVTEGEAPKTVTIGAKTYEISVAFAASSTVKLTVGSETTKALASGATYKLNDGTYVGIKEYLYNSKDTGVSQAEVSIGAGKLKIDNTEAVELNDEDIDGLTGYLDIAASGLDKIVFSWDVDDEEFITPDQDLAMPGFGAVKFSMGGFSAGAGETTEIDASTDDSIALKIPLKDGDATINLYKVNTTGGIADGAPTNAVLGKDTDERLVTSSNNVIRFNETRGDEYFIASWNSTTEAESYLLKVTSFKNDSGTLKVTITNKVATTDKCEDVEAAGECEFGNVVLTVNDIEKNGANKWVNMTGGGGVSFHKVFTKEGLMFQLPYVQDTADCGRGAIGNESSACYYPTGAFVLHASEEDKDGNIGSSDFNITLGVTSTDYDVQVASVDMHGGADTELEIGSTDVFESYTKSDLATKVLWDKSGSQDDAKIVYAGEESYADVYVASSTATTIPIEGQVVIVTDAEVSSVSDKNLIVVGGSCVNTVAAKVLGSDTPVCAEDFTSQTGVGAGQYILKVVTSPYNADKVAMLVAGYDAADTANAASKLLEGVVTDVGTSEVYPQASA